ncbi:RDD family protein [Streptomyces sp. NPDC001380]|uniref:RDD family protein n=1 Tax=Streptomyces sp. NPDC001380 TaxID=3364566 RepID=UPI00367AFCBC
MSYPPGPNDPYAQQPQAGYGYPQQQPPQQPGSAYPQQPGYAYPQQPQQPGYAYPQQPQQPGYAYPQGQPGYDPNAAAAYGYPQQPPYGAVPYGTPQIASMGARFGARLIDGVLVGVVCWILMVAGVAGAVGIGAKAKTEYNPTTGQYELSPSASMGVLGVTMVLMLVIFVLQLCYEWLMVAFAGATLGKRMVGLRVVNETTGQNPGLGSSFVRFIIPIVGWALCYLPGLLVWLSPFFDNSGRQQGWHDKAAHTLVIRK